MLHLSLPLGISPHQSSHPRRLGSDFPGVNFQLSSQLYFAQILVLIPSTGHEDLSCLGSRSMVARGVSTRARSDTRQPRHPNKAKFVADYLLSRAQAALEATDALESGHAQYVASMAGTWGWGPVALLASCFYFYTSSSPQLLRGHQQAGNALVMEGHGGWSWWVPMPLFEEQPASWRGQYRPLQALLLILEGLRGWAAAPGTWHAVPWAGGARPHPLAADAAGLVGALALFAHLTADTIVNGSATSHLAPTDHADRECRLRLLGRLFAPGDCLWEPPPLGAGYGAHLPQGCAGVPQLPVLPFAIFPPAGAPSRSRNVALLLVTDLCSSAGNQLDAADAQHHLCGQGKEEEEGGRAGMGDPLPKGLGTDPSSPQG